jgi:hypothetical protein
MRCRKCGNEMIFIAEKGKKILGVKIKQIALACWDCGIATIQEYQEREHGLRKRIVNVH